MQVNINSVHYFEFDTLSMMGCSSQSPDNSQCAKSPIDVQRVFNKASRNKNEKNQKQTAILHTFFTFFKIELIQRILRYLSIFISACFIN